MNFEQYYPTPAEIGERLAKMIEEPQPPILEPSAGGFEDRTDWTRTLKNDLTSEYAKDYDDPQFAAIF